MILDTMTIQSAAFEKHTGWAVKPEGLCKGDLCVPAPDVRIDGGDELDVGVLSDRLGMALVEDEVSGTQALGPASLGRALETAKAPYLELPDYAQVGGPETTSNPFRLDSLLGRKVLLVAWASW